MRTRICEQVFLFCFDKKKKKSLYLQNMTGVKHKGKQFIYDAFTRGGQLFLVSTYYSTTEARSVVTVNGIDAQEFGYNEYEPVRYFVCNAPEDPTLSVVIDGKSEYTMVLDTQSDVKENIITLNEMAMGTLFKDDYHKIEMYCAWYRKQGFTRFYLYYNGGKLPTDLYQADDIVYQTWDFDYWNKQTSTCNVLHNAQMTFITCMKLRHFGRFRWFGLVDLDELVFHPSCKLDEYFDAQDPKTSVIVAKNHWALKSKRHLVFNQSPHVHGRTKCFYRHTFGGIPAIHLPKAQQSVSASILRTTPLVMVHYVDDRDPKQRQNDAQRRLSSTVGKIHFSHMLVKDSCKFTKKFISN